MKRNRVKIRFPDLDGDPAAVACPAQKNFSPSVRVQIEFEVRRPYTAWNVGCLRGWLRSERSEGAYHRNRLQGDSTRSSN